MSRAWAGVRPPAGRDARLIRLPAVAGSFYPAEPSELATMTRHLLEAARRIREHARSSPTSPAGLLVPHAGLIFSGVVAAAGWSSLTRWGTTLPADSRRPTIVILGTNHGAAWLDGVAAWDAGAWRTPIGDLDVDEELAAAIVALGPPFAVDREAHGGEHSIEVQLPLIRFAAPEARIVPLSVSAGVGQPAIDAGERLGRLLGTRLAEGAPICLAISSDMAHYPPAAACSEATDVLRPSILGLDPEGLAAREAAVSASGVPGLVCGMCGIQPAVLGLAALRALAATAATPLAAATSADAGGPEGRTVGYLSAAFDVPGEQAAS